MFFNMFVDPSTNQDIINKGAPLIYILVLLQIFDFSQGIFSGFYRGIGKQFLAMSVTLANNFVIQLVFAILFGIGLHRGVEGIFLGILTGAVLVCATYAIITSVLDLDEIREDIILRLQQEQNYLNEKENSISRKNVPEYEIDNVLKKDPENMESRTDFEEKEKLIAR